MKQTKTHAESSPPSQYRDLFDAPALADRCKQIRHQSPVELDAGDAAYLGAWELLEAFPRHEADILEAIADHKAATERGGRHE